MAKPKSQHIQVCSPLPRSILFPSLQRPRLALMVYLSSFPSKPSANIFNSSEWHPRASRARTRQKEMAKEIRQGSSCSPEQQRKLLLHQWNDSEPYVPSFFASGRRRRRRQIPRPEHHERQPCRLPAVLSPW